MLSLLLQMTPSQNNNSEENEAIFEISSCEKFPRLFFLWEFISLVCPQMPFYRILLVTRNDLAVASLYNKFVETAKYVIINGGVLQRIYNTGNQIFRWDIEEFSFILGIPYTVRQTRKHIEKDLCFLFNFAVHHRWWRVFVRI